MESHKSRYDPRFYLVKINSLVFFKPPQQDFNLLFRLGTKISESKYTLDDLDNQGKKQPFELKKEAASREVHIFKYGAEQFLNTFLISGKDQQSYSRILLPPLFERPHTKHNITVTLFDNIFKGQQNINEEATASAKLNLDIYFQFNFAGSLEIIPVSAQLERNIAQIGEMKSKVRLEFQENSWCSLEAEGGIRPHWSGHYFAKRDTDQGFIHTIEENLIVNKRDLVSRMLKMNQNSLGIIGSKQENSQGSKGPYFDCTEFQMKSAGSYLKVEILSTPFIGSKPDIIGTANIRVEDQGLLKYPRKPNQKLFQEKLIQLYHYDELAGENLKVGVLKIYVRFVFDLEKFINKNKRAYLQFN